ncbi:sugar kinase [Priestia megaterium]|jgi:2-dehydro-3-deoxygluconokinase
MDVITLGEAMVLFEPASSEKIKYESLFKKRIGGAESNIAIGLAKLGHSVSWISKLGNDAFGDYILSYIRGEGVDVSNVVVTGEYRTGIYFKDAFYNNKTEVYYYRDDSAASHLNPEDINEELFLDSKILHLTGITPLLSKDNFETVLYAIDLAKKHNLMITFDPNLRMKLKRSSEMKETMQRIVQKVDYFLPGRQEFEHLYGSSSDEKVFQLLLEKGLKAVVLKDGKDGAILYENGRKQKIAGVPNNHVVDPVGAGDGFAAGFLSGLIENLNLEASVKRGNIIGSLVVGVKGDNEGLPSRKDIDEFLLKRNDVIR